MSTEARCENERELGVLTTTCMTWIVTIGVARALADETRRPYALFGNPTPLYSRVSNTLSPQENAAVPQIAYKDERICVTFI